MMVRNHEGAVEMAKTEQQDGAYQPAKDMAGAIVTSQTAESHAAASAKHA